MNSSTPPPKTNYRYHYPSLSEPNSGHFSFLIIRTRQKSAIGAPSIASMMKLALLQNQNKTFTIKASYGKRRKSFLWPVDLSAVTLDDMKRTILNTFPSLQNTKPEDITLHFCKAGEKKCEELGLKKDDTFRQYLKTFAMQASLFLKVQINTIQKPFSDWSLKKVCDLLRLPLTFQDFPKFECGIDSLNDPLAKELLLHLRTDLKYRQKTISTNVNEASRSEEHTS